MMSEGRTKTASNAALVRRRRPERARRAANTPRRPTGVEALPTVIVVSLARLRLLDGLAGRHRLLVGRVQLVCETLRRLLAGEDVLEAVTHRVVELGGREDIDVVAKCSGRPRRLGEVAQDLSEQR